MTYLQNLFINSFIFSCIKNLPLIRWCHITFNELCLKIQHLKSSVFWPKKHDQIALKIGKIFTLKSSYLLWCLNRFIMIVVVDMEIKSSYYISSLLTFFWSTTFRDLTSLVSWSRMMYWSRGWVGVSRWCVSRVALDQVVILVTSSRNINSASGSMHHTWSRDQWC